MIFENRAGTVVKPRFLKVQVRLSAHRDLSEIAKIVKMAIKKHEKMII